MCDPSSPKAWFISNMQYLWMASRIDVTSLQNSTMHCEHYKRKMTIAKSEKDPKKNNTQNKGQLQAHMELQNPKI